MSKAVRDRIARCLTVVVAGYAYAAVGGEAARRLMHDFLHRQRRAAAGGETQERAPSIEDLMRLAAAELEDLCRAMVEADAALHSSRATLRRRRRRRDRRASRLYDFLATTRKLFKGLFGDRAVIDHLGLRGPTPRNPRILLTDARYAGAALADPERELECSYSASGWFKTSAMARRLGTRCDRLAEALAAVISADAAESAAQELQRRAIEEFDPCCLKTARLFERLLDDLGLPTLASNVRPGVKRRGRPAKSRPVDLFPDLVQHGIAKLKAIDASQVLVRMVGAENAAVLQAVEAAARPAPAPDPAEHGAGGEEDGTGLKPDAAKS